MAQFPKVNIGFNKQRDNTNVHSYGFAVSVDLPIFDRNQGAIARRPPPASGCLMSMRSVFEARSDVATAMADIAAIEEQLAATRLPCRVFRRSQTHTKRAWSGETWT